MKQPKPTFKGDDLWFRFLQDGQEINCRVEDLWIQQESDYSVGQDPLTPDDEQLIKAFNECWPKIEKRVAQRIENKQFESDGTIYLRGK